MIRTAKGPLVTLPYTIECNDIPVMIVQHHNSDYLLKLVKDQFDRLYAESATRAKICALAIHPYISGQPHRIKYLERSTTTSTGMTACCTGTASRFSTGIAALPRSRLPLAFRRKRYMASGRTTCASGF